MINDADKSQKSSWFGSKIILGFRKSDPLFYSLGGCCITLLDHNSPFRELEARWICFSKPFKTDFWLDYKSLVGRTNADNPEEKQRTSP